MFSEFVTLNFLSHCIPIPVNSYNNLFKGLEVNAIKITYVLRPKYRSKILYVCLVGKMVMVV